MRDSGRTTIADCYCLCYYMHKPGILLASDKALMCSNRHVIVVATSCAVIDCVGATVQAFNVLESDIEKLSEHRHLLRSAMVFSL